MRAVANCSVSILRGLDTDQYGDAVDSTNVVATRVAMSILEQRRQTTRRADDRAQTLLYCTGRVSPRIDVRVEDRLQDELTGTIYLVTAASGVGSPVTTNDVRLDLEKVADRAPLLVT